MLDDGHVWDRIWHEPVSATDPHRLQLQTTGSRGMGAHSLHLEGHQAQAYLRPMRMTSQGYGCELRLLDERRDHAAVIAENRVAARPRVELLDLAGGKHATAGH